MAMLDDWAGGYITNHYNVDGPRVQIEWDQEREEYHIYVKGGHLGSNVIDLWLTMDAKKAHQFFNDFDCAVNAAVQERLEARGELEVRR